MIEYKFTKNRIHEHFEKLGFDVRPIIETKMERERLWTFGQYLVETYPVLFESLVTGLTEFHVRKKLIFPGKGEADLQTLVLTARGPVFVFPRVLSRLDAETDLPAANEIVRDCLKKFTEVFPDRAIVRAGKINEYVFGCDDTSSKRIIAERFLRVPDSACEEIVLKLNLGTEGFNRSIQLRSVQGFVQKRTGDEVSKQPIFGISVHVDFNNKDMSKALSPEEISSILHLADEYNREGLYKFLNREE